MSNENLSTRLSAPPSAARQIGFGLLVFHLMLSPLVFSAATVEVFEYNKVLLLQATTLLLLGLGVDSLTRLVIGRPGGEPPRLLERLRRSLDRDPVAWGMIAFFVSALISTIWSMSPRTSFYGAHESFLGLCTVAAYLVLFFATRTLTGSMRDARALFWATATAAAGSTTYALVQLVRLDPISWGRTASYGDFTRIFATMGHPNFLSAYLVTAFPALAYLAVRAWRRERRGVAIALSLVIVVSWAVTLASVSRGAWGALFLAFVVLWFGWWRVGERTGTRALGLVLVLAATIGLAAFWAFVPDGRELLHNVERRIADLAKIGNESRIHIWKAALAMFRDHPITGVGLDGFQLAFEPYRTAEYWHVEWNGTPTKAHNELLHIAATQGAIGLGALALLTLGLALAFRRALRRAKNSEQRALLVALAAGLVGFYAQNLFSFTVAGCGTLAVTYMALLSRFGGYDRRPDGLAHKPGTQIDTETAASAANEPLEPEPQPALSPLALALVLGMGGIVALAVLAGSIPEQPGNTAWERKRTIALTLYLASLLAVPWAMLRAARGSERRENLVPQAALRPRAEQRPWIRPDRLKWVRLGRALTWLLVALGLWHGIVIPFRANAACRQGRSLVAAGRFREAIAMLERAVSLDPAKELNWVQLGTAYYTASFYEPRPERRRELLRQAVIAHLRSVKLVPVNAYDHANVARALGELARLRPPGATPREVFERFDRALAIDPNNAYFLNDAARAALALGDIEHARYYARRNCELYPYYGPARAQLGAVFMREKRWKEAETELQAAMSGNWFEDASSKVSAAINLASTRIALGKFQSALAAADYAVQLGGQSVSAWRKKARTHELFAAELERQGQHERAKRQREAARRSYRRVLELAPTDGFAKAALARLDEKIP